MRMMDKCLLDYSAASTPLECAATLYKGIVLRCERFVEAEAEVVVVFLVLKRLIFMDLCSVLLI